MGGGGRNLFLPHVFLFGDIRLGAQLSKSVEGSGIDRPMTIHPRQLSLWISENIDEIGDKRLVFESVRMSVNVVQNTSCNIFQN